MGIPFQYLKPEDIKKFCDALAKEMKAEHGTKVYHWLDKYLDCEGHVDLLCETLSFDICKAMAISTDRVGIYRKYISGANVLIWQCQAETFSVFGDVKMEAKLRKRSYLK